MDTSRFLIGIMLAMVSLPACSDELTQAKQALDVGAAQLALQQLDAMPMPSTDEQRATWLQLTWQSLKLDGDDQAIVNHAAKLPDDAPVAMRHDVDVMAAQSAIKLGEGTLARHYLRQLLWHMSVQPAELMMLRAMVVQSHLVPQPDADAPSLFLRYQQDFGVDADLQKMYVLAMLRAGKVADLTTLRATLSNQDLLAMLIDADNTQLSDAAIHPQIVALLATQPDTQTVQLLVKPVAALHDDAVQARVVEYALSLFTPPTGTDAALLWKNYHSLTQSFGNVRLLLFGSDAGWADQARAVLADDPLMARAIWSYLAREAKDVQLKDQAQQQLLDQLSAAKLGRTALRLFEAAWANLPAQTFSPAVQYRLGGLALAAGDDVEAAELWKDAGIIPPGIDLAVWQAQRALLFGRLHAWSSAMDAVSAWLAQPNVMAGDAAWPMLLLTERLSHEPDQSRQAQSLLMQMWPNANLAQQQLIAQRLAQLMALTQPVQAAQWYLRVAQDSSVVDERSVWQARLDAAACLDKAGLHGDAHRIYQSLSTQSVYPVLQAQARDALGGE